MAMRKKTVAAAAAAVPLTEARFEEAVRQLSTLMNTARRNTRVMLTTHVPAVVEGFCEGRADGEEFDTHLLFATGYGTGYLLGATVHTLNVVTWPFRKLFGCKSAC